MEIQPGNLPPAKLKRVSPGQGIFSGQLNPDQVPDQDFNFLPSKLKLSPPPENLYKCNQGYLVGSTAPGQLDGKFYLKSLHCGREWCESCGSDYSIPHNRRISRCFDGVLASSGLGYLVITVPKELRDFTQKREFLQDFKTYWKRKLKRKEHYNAGYKVIQGKTFKNYSRIKIVPNVKTRAGYNYGLIRYHYAGEDGQTWKPHLNILIPAQYLHKNLLRKWKVDLVKWFIDYFELDPQAYDYTPVANIYYAYTDNTEKQIHWLKYILRSTLKNTRLCDDIEKELYNYKNTTRWGKWPVSGVPASDASEVFNKNICPETGKPIIWEYFVKHKEAVVTEKYKTLGLGILSAVGHLSPGRYMGVKDKRLKNNRLRNKADTSFPKDPPDIWEGRMRPNDCRYIWN